MMRKGSNRSAYTCSFCGRGTSQVDKMISGPSVQICSDCVRTCYDIIRETSVKKTVTIDFEIPNPEEIKKKLDEYVIGQERSKKLLSFAVYNQYKR
ncbi:MAG TPA: ClpX C4-type zinc finger protein, partial [Anaerolineae bacterium]|nr:ClpX C4-type zinc finger protein [Anaerolineae bacterium]